MSKRAGNNSWTPPRIDPWEGNQVICRGAHFKSRHWIWALTLLITLSFASVLPGANVVILNLDGAGEGLNDPTPVAPVGGNPGMTVGQQRLNVFQRAAEFWGSRLVSSVPIRVGAKFDPLSCTANAGTLGSAGPVSLFRDFAGAPVPNTYYASALANALAGTDLDPASDDIDATFNSDVGTSGCLATLRWYYGFDHNAPANSIDFLDTAMHEFAHGLGFICAVNLSTGTKFNGFDDTFMRQLEDHRTGSLYPAMTDAERVSASIATGNLHWVGSNVLSMIGILSAGTSGGHVQMFAPNPQQPGSSVSHWDTALFPDELLEPYDTSTSDYRLTVQLMKDIGWRLAGAVPQVVTNGSVFLAENCGFGNSAIDPGETVTVAFKLRNSGTADTGDLVATLVPGNGLSAPSGPQTYGKLVANGVDVSRSFTFTATNGCATTLTATLQLRDGTNSLGSVSYRFKIGSTISFTNNATITVPSSGSGAPYPSTLTISNQTDTIQGLVVTLLGVTHSNPDDLDILLVGPSGQSVVLMSDAGGSADINNVTLTFDDMAANSLPDSTQINSGTFNPTDYPPADTYPAPAPAGPYGAALSVFNGTNPNGAWRLFVRDDTNPRAGSIAGWALTLPACCNSFGPLLTLTPGTVTYVENGAPVLIDSSASVSASATNFSNGSLVVGAVTNASSADRIFIRNEGTSAGQIGLAGTTVTFGGVAFASFTTNAALLTVSFTSTNASVTAVQALARNVTFAVDSDNPATSKTVRFALTDGHAASASIGYKIVQITPVNDPPVLAAVADQIVNAGASLVLSNSATDVDSLPAALRFSLGSGAPAGATINATNGIFRWTPTSVQAPSTNRVSIIVSDNGLPSLSATQTFTIIVRPVNHAPSLAAISDRVIHQGATVTFTNVATDPDQPPNTLAFSLLNPPSGATVNTISGVFSWTPSAQQAPSTNTIGVVVTDDGNPPLTDMQSFKVTVQLPPRIQSISLSGTNVTLQWTAISTQGYQVQYQSTLVETNWTDLGGPVNASSTTATRQDGVQPNQQRFYRILVTP